VATPPPDPFLPKTYTLYVSANVAVFEDGGIIGDDLWYPFAGIVIVHPSGCYGVPPTSGISQHPQPFQRIDKTARRPYRPLLTPKCHHYRQRHQQVTRLDQYTIGPYNNSQSIKWFLR